MRVGGSKLQHKDRTVGVSCLHGLNMSKNVSVIQVHELLEQQNLKKKSLQQLENSYNIFVHTIMDKTSTRLDSILKDVEDIKSSHTERSGSTQSVVQQPWFLQSTQEQQSHH